MSDKLQFVVDFAINPPVGSDKLKFVGLTSGLSA